MTDYQELERMLRGSWPAFIRECTGYEIQKFNKGGHPCPQCGGNDRAHWRLKDGRVGLFCRAACGASDSAYGSNTMTTPEQFIMDYNGWDFPALCRAAEQFLNVVPNNSSNKSKERTVRADLKAVIDKASPIKWHESWLAGRFMIKPDELFMIDGIESVPIIGEWSERTEAFLQIAGYGKQRVIGSMSATGLYAVIGSLTKRKVFFTNYCAAWVYHHVTGEQCIFSPLPGYFKKSGCSAVFVKNGEYDTLDKASGFYGVTNYIYPVKPSFFEFDKKLVEVNHDQLCALLTGVECGTL